MKHFIYLHRNPINQEVYYIGQGTLQNNKPTRAYSNKSRSIWWNNYTEKYGSPIVEIILINIDKETADLMEIYYIRKYGRKDINEGSLVNLTDGGDGNGPRSMEYKKEHSIRMSGENHPMYGRKHSDEWNLNSSIAQIGRKLSDETKKKMSESRKGGKRNDETKKKMSIAQSGEKNGMYGRTGTSSPSSKLDCDKVNNIRELYKNGDTSFRKLGKLFNVSYSTIESIVKNKTWIIINND